MKKVKYMGHIVSKDGVEPDHDKIFKVKKNWPIPSNSYQVRQIKGFAGYFYKFITDFAKVSRPLIDVIAVGKKRRQIQSGDRTRNNKLHSVS